MTVEAFGQDLTDSGGTAVTTGAINTKGSYVELAASTSNNNKWLEVVLSSTNNNQSFLVDIAVGAASSEVVVVANISHFTDARVGERVVLPISIASGSRVSVRAQAALASAVIDVAIHLSDSTLAGTSPSNITLGADTAASVGTAVDAGGTANTKGAYAELDASTSADIDWLLVMVHSNNNAVLSNASFLIDIATGAASSEVVVVDDIFYKTNTTEIVAPAVFVIPVTIASGTRVAARCQSTTTDAADRIIDVIIIGCNMDAAAGGGGAPKQAGRGGGMAG